MLPAREFQSTLPAWGATEAIGALNAEVKISIHTPRMGSDSLIVMRLSYDNISIHTPRMGSDGKRICHNKMEYQFQSTLPAWGATTFCMLTLCSPLFQSTLPAWGATLRRKL